MEQSTTNSNFRVGIIGIAHESNTFLKKPTTLEDFQNSVAMRGEKIRESYGTAHHEITGFLQTLEAAGMEAVPLFYAHATPGGTISAGVIDTLWGMAKEELDAAGKLDGFLVAPHGAAVDASHGDMDGWWLTELRNKVGPDIPIISTLDPHSSVTQKMIDACDISITYRRNPHLDQRQRGVEAAELMVRTLRGEIKPTQAVSLPSFAINIERQLTDSDPILSLQAKVQEIRDRPKVLSASLILGFPYADVPEMGSGFIVATDNDPALAKQYVQELTDYLWDHKEDFRGVMISIDEAIEQAAESPKPVCLLDMGDNIGGGSPGDGTLLLHALKARGDLKTFGTIFDPESVQQAQKAKPGDRIHLIMGGKTDPLHGEPFEADVTVRSFHDGKYRELEARHGGATDKDMGAAVVLDTDDGITLMLTSRRHGSSSLQQLISSDVDPLAYDVLIAKGVHAPVAAYAPVCPTLIRVNTPGITTADMDALEYKNRRKPMFPFEG
jgi:microcystin degradation protein MlrC